MSNQSLSQQQQQQLPSMEAYGSDVSYQQPMSPADVVFGLALQFGFDLVQRALASPTDRLVLLSTVEGELKQQGRLPPKTGFGGIVRLVKRLYRKEGVSGFFRGVLTDSVLAFPTMFIDALSTNLVFLALQRCMPAHIANALGPMEVMLLSIGATWAAVMVASPISAVRKTISTNYVADIVAPKQATEADVEAEKAEEDGNGVEEGGAGAKTTVKEEGYRYGNAQECAKTIYKSGGVRAFYRGALVDPLTMCVYRGLYALTSLCVPAYYQVYHPYAVARAMALLADVATQPFEVICRRLVLTASADADEVLANTGTNEKQESDRHRYRYNGVLDCVQTVIREEGWQALFAGLRCRLVVTAGSMLLRASLSALTGGGNDQYT